MDRITRWLRRAEQFLDEYGQGAWIAAFVLGFILVWPIGLAILGYALWSGRMGCWKNRRRNKTRRETGNTAFDEYRDATLRRLEEEQADFEDFLARLRRAKDKAQFDEFMSSRSRSDADPMPA
ncbi:MAG: DUF2852 domain-containing protein [Pseudomonadota bacterium]